jgi:chromosome segregation ATPase
MSSPKELGQLERQRSRLENELLSLKEQQTRLEERAKALEQKLVEELTSKNDESRQNISRLESAISDLVQRLAQITQEARTTEPSKDESASQMSNLEVKENVVTEISPKEEPVTVAPLNDSSKASEDDSEPHQVSKKQKRRFWETHSY